MPGTLAHPAYGQARPVTDQAAVIVAPNSGPMTLEGTNTWLLGAPGQQGRVLVDPGPMDEQHAEAVIAAAGAIELILVTHRHIDHTAGIDMLAERTGAPVRALLPEHCRDAAPLGEGEALRASGIALTVLPAPGHTADSIMLAVADGAVPLLLTGDTILGRGTTVLDATDGDLGDYLDTLGAIIDDRSGHLVLPGHGPELPDAAAAASAYKAHRLHRLEEVREALRVLGEDASARDIVERVYVAVDPALWGAAESSVRAQLAYLRDRA
ncbi:MBL fold metallo-hydrolase [Hoyosella sp. G463]|uniref:MBL fold metallo-hydrolase n=1 Tax=Lolliginicoccus lacisalsi TaxID=2742202 RepID=A0A927JEQ0_9ACTN|nr:MBL fold metallo-hydrolase [Lolliginicoccus lacisalsi]MBD8507242.1 MBL fold metallo-hydrolase [Lolliginicoccus lacisalsi]